MVADDEIVKVHIHAEHPGSVLNFAMNYGSLHKIKIDNMREQHRHILLGEGKYHQPSGEVATVDTAQKDKIVDTSHIEHKETQLFGIVAVAMGDGVAEIFKSLGVDVVITGGQTMNPSTEDIVNAMREVSAEQFIVLPNNSNIILAAEQAEDFMDLPVVVVPAKTIPQGMASLLAFNPNASLSENKEMMTKALKNVKTGQVTYAVRDSQYEGLEIKEGDYLGIAEGKIVTTSNDLMETANQLLSKMIDEEEVLTVIYGSDVNEELVKQLQAIITEQYPNLEIEMHNGGQPLYYFIFSIE